MYDNDQLSQLSSAESQQKYLAMSNAINGQLHRISVYYPCNSTIYSALIQRELKDARNKFTCWKLHVCNWEREIIYCLQHQPSRILEYLYNWNPKKTDLPLLVRWVYSLTILCTQSNSSSSLITRRNL